MNKVHLLSKEWSSYSLYLATTLLSEKHEVGHRAVPMEQQLKTTKMPKKKKKKVKFTNEVMQIRKAQVTSSEEQQIPEELWLAKTRGAAKHAGARAIHSGCLCAEGREGGGTQDPSL